MANVCGECRYIDLCDIKDGKAYCKEKKERRFANSKDAEGCNRFFKKFIYDTETANAIKEADKKNPTSPELTGCFITTATVNILGLSDECEELQILRWFRKEVLQVLPEYRDLLLKYDTFGPIIARALSLDEDALHIAKVLFKVYIKGCVSLVKKGEFDEAVSHYIEMTEYLINKYMPNVFVPEEYKEKYDQSHGGHGYTIQKKA